MTMVNLNVQLQEQLYRYQNTYSDINEHLSYLRYIAGMVDGPVVEFGARHGVSTTALLQGMVDRPARNRAPVVTCDIQRKDREMSFLEQVAAYNEMVFQYLDFDTFTSRRSDLPVTDYGVLFIDTLHVREQIYYELTTFAPGVRRGGVIILHDTETFWNRPEIPSYTEGLGPGILQFLEEKPNWRRYTHFPNNNGLTVLARTTDEINY